MSQVEYSRHTRQGAAVRLRLWPRIVALAGILGLVVVIGVVMERRMMAEPLSFTELNRLGRTQVGAQVVEQSRQSLPVPVRTEGSVRIAFLYTPARALPNVTRLGSPNQVVWFDADGRLVAIESVTPQTFGQSAMAGQSMGEFRLPPSMTATEYLTERDRLFVLYDQLVPAWAGHTELSADAQRGAAQEFLRLFADVAEPPLLPYYEALGADFFHWMHTAAT